MENDFTLNCTAKPAPFLFGSYYNELLSQIKTESSQSKCWRFIASDSNTSACIETPVSCISYKGAVDPCVAKLKMSKFSTKLNSSSTPKVQAKVNILQNTVIGPLSSKTKLSEKNSRINESQEKRRQSEESVSDIESFSRYIITRGDSTSESSGISLKFSPRHLNSRDRNKNKLKSVAINLFQDSNSSNTSEDGNERNDNIHSDPYKKNSKNKHNSSNNSQSVVKQRKTGNHSNISRTASQCRSSKFSNGKGLHAHKKFKETKKSKVFSDESSVFSSSDDERQYRTLITEFDDLNESQQHEKIHSFLDRWCPYNGNDISKHLGTAEIKSPCVTLAVENLLKISSTHSFQCTMSNQQDTTKDTCNICKTSFVSMEKCPEKENICSNTNRSHICTELNNYEPLFLENSPISGNRKNIKNQLSGNDDLHPYDENESVKRSVGNHNGINSNCNSARIVSSGESKCYTKPQSVKINAICNNQDEEEVINKKTTPYSSKGFSNYDTHLDDGEDRINCAEESSSEGRPERSKQKTAVQQKKFSSISKIDTCTGIKDVANANSKLGKPKRNKIKPKRSNSNETQDSNNTKGLMKKEIAMRKKLKRKLQSDDAKNGGNLTNELVTKTSTKIISHKPPAKTVKAFISPEQEKHKSRKKKANKSGKSMELQQKDEKDLEATTISNGGVVQVFL